MAYTGFKKMAQKVGSPALAAYIGRKKYGKEKFQQAASQHKSLKGAAARRMGQKK